MAEKIIEQLLDGLARSARKRRLELGLSARSLSKILDEKSTFVQELEWSNLRDLDIAQLKRIADALRFDGVADLINHATQEMQEKSKA